MKILVCISNAPDTTTKVKFSPDGKNFVTEGVQWIINPWDELALTRAVELKEKYPNTIDKITIASVGGSGIEPTMRKALAVGGDNAIRIDTEASDSYQVAQQLTQIAADYDLVLFGIEASDYQGGASGQMLAELLDWPSVTGVSHLDIQDGIPLVTREVQGGKERLKVTVPMILIAQKGIAHIPRIASIRGIMSARRKTLEVIPGIAAEAMVDYCHFELPEPKKACVMLNADQTNELIELLHNEAKVL